MELISPFPRDSFHDLARDAKRPNGVPHADKRDADLVAKCPAKLARFLHVRPCSAPIHQVAGWNEVGVKFLQGPRVANETRHTPRRVRATAKAEQVDLVALHVVVDQEPIGILDVLVETSAEGATADSLPTVRSHPPVIEDLLRHTMAVHGSQRSCGAHDVRDMPLLRAIPRAI